MAGDNSRPINETEEERQERIRRQQDHEPLDQDFFDQFAVYKNGGSSQQSKS